MEERRQTDHDYNAIIIKLEAIRLEMASNHKSFREFADEMKKIQDKIQDTVYGNGHAGLVTKISGIEDVKNDVKWQGRILYMALGAMALIDFYFRVFK